MSTGDSLPDDIDTLKRLLRARDAELAQVGAEASSTQALIAHLRLAIEKMRREMYGPRSERKARLLDQMELQLEELEATATEDELAAEKAAAGNAEVRAFTRRKPSRKLFPAQLPGQRIVGPGPTECACCGSTRLAKLGEDVTETLEVVPRQWKVVQHVREKFTCRACEAISQPPAPFHVLPRGLAGPSLLAMILFEKYGQHRSIAKPTAMRASGRDPPAAVFFYSRDRAGEHCERHCRALQDSCRPMPTRGSTGSTRPPAREARSPRPPAGRTAGASSSCSPM